jgi:hypothetical protein
MLVIQGVVTDITNFRPAPTEKQPNPPTYRSIVLEGCSIGLPDSWSAPLPAIGALYSVPVVAQRANNGGFKFKAVPNIQAK